MYPILFLCCLRSCNTNSENNISPAFPFNELNRAAGKSGGQTVRKEGRKEGKEECLRDVCFAGNLWQVSLSFK